MDIDLVFIQTELNQLHILIYSITELSTIQMRTNTNDIDLYSQYVWRSFYGLTQPTI